MSILHLVADLDDTLSRVYRALKPGGRFFSSTVCIGDMGRFVRYALPPLGAIGILPKILPLTPDLLTERMTAQGLVIEHVWCPSEGAAVFVVARRPK